MRRVGLRHILPVPLTILYLALIVLGMTQEKAFEQELEKFIGPEKPPTATGLGKTQEEASQPTLDLRSLGGPPPAIEIAMAVHLPAALAAFPLLLVAVLVLPERIDMWISYIIWGIFVPLNWYYVGRWLDRRMGLAPPVQKKPSSLAAAFGCLLLAGISGIMALALFTVHFCQGRCVPAAMLAWNAWGAIVGAVPLSRETSICASKKL